MKPICQRCKKRLTLEPYLPGDPFMRVTGQSYLGTVCTECGWVECYKCRGRIGAPCSKCNGSVSAAFEHLFTQTSSQSAGKGDRWAFWGRG